MIYARVHDRTVAEDYYAAMDIVEKRLDPGVDTTPAGAPTSDNTCQLLNVDESARLLALVEILRDGNLNEVQEKAVQELREGTLALVAPRESAKLSC